MVRIRSTKNFHIHKLRESKVRTRISRKGTWCYIKGCGKRYRRQDTFGGAQILLEATLVPPGGGYRGWKMLHDEVFRETRPRGEVTSFDGPNECGDDGAEESAM